ncbi:hypothetical protein N9B73_10540 [Verrucomicrobiales bacterium]|nr:hypothetical protein [Verrucomicrobiales bacterium]
MRLYSLLAGLLLIASSAMAQLPVAELKRDTPVNFATEVYPFLKTNCLACHNTTKAKADLILESPQDMIKGGESGPAIEPKNADNSFLFTTAAHIEEPTMPPANNKSKAKNLTPDQLALLKRWIDEGAEGDSVSTAAPESWSLLTGPQPIYTSALTDDGRFAAAGRGQKIDLYDLRLGKLVTSLKDPSLQHPTAHRDLVQSMDFSSDGTLASGGYRSVKIWERSTEKASEPLTLTADPVTSRLSPKRDRLAVGYADGTISVFDLKAEKQTVATIKDHSGAINSFSFSPDGLWLYSVSADKTIRRRTIADISKSTSLALPSPANAIAVVNNGKHLFVGGDDQLMRLCSSDLVTPLLAIVTSPTPTPEAKSTTAKPVPAAKTPPAKATPPVPEKSKPAATTPASSAAVSPKAQPPAKPAPKATPKPEAKPAPAPNAAMKTKAAPATQAPKPATPKPKPKPTAKPVPKLLAQFKFQSHPIVALELVNADGTELLAAHKDGTIIHFKLDPAKITATPAQVRQFLHGAPLNQLAVSLTGTSAPRAATAGPAGAVNLWNLADGKKISEFKSDPNTQPLLDSFTRQTAVVNRRKAHWEKAAPVAAKLSKDESEKAKASGDTIAKARRDKVAKKTTLDTLLAQEPPAKEDDITKATEALAESDRALTSTIRNRDSSSRLAGDAYADQISTEAAALEATALAASLKTESDALKKADADALKTIISLDIAFTPNGETFAAALKGGGLRLWSSETGTWLEDVKRPQAASRMHFTSDSQVLVSSADKKIVPWTLPGEQWALTKTLGDGNSPEPFVDRVSALTFHPDGGKLATGTGVPSRSGEIVIWDTTTWELLVENDEAHHDTITSFAFSPDGGRIASGGTDQFVKVFATDSLEHEKTFEGHTSHVLDVDWNADDLTLVSSSADLQVKVWDITNTQQKSKVEGFQKEVASVSFVGDTDTLLTASGDKTLKLANQPLPGAGTTFLHTANVSADGKQIIAAGQDSVLRVWDASTKKLIREFPSPEADAGKVAAE